MNAWLWTASALGFSGGLGAIVNWSLRAVKEGVLGEMSVRYVRGGQFALFTRVGNELRESWDNHPYRVLFRSALIEDQALRMEHRDKVLRDQGFVPDRPWQELFPLDAVVPED